LAQFSVVMLLCAVPVESATPVQVERLDGTKSKGDWLGADPATIRLRIGDATETIPLDDLACIDFGNPAGMFASDSDPLKTDVSDLPAADRPTMVTRLDDGEAAYPAKFFLNDGGAFEGFVLSGAPPENVLTNSMLGARQAVPFGRLAALRFAAAERFTRAEELLQTALDDRQPGQDAFVTRDADEPKLLRGVLESLDATGGTFRFADRERSFQVDRTYGLVFATGAMNDAGAKSPVTFCLRDGTRVSGAIENADDHELSFAASLGFSVRLRISDLSRLDVQSDRLVYLNTLTPDRQDTRGLLHRPWPVERNRNLFGGPLTIAGRTFSRGICTHSRTELVYVIDREFDSFAATVGLDDSVGSLGSVVFRVLGDGAVLSETGPVTGSDAPLDVVVPLSGVTELTIIVDFGDGLDLGDHAVWGNARLIRPRGRSTGPS
jgi:hypothetical protein